MDFFQWVCLVECHGDFGKSPNCCGGKKSDLGLLDGKA